MTILNNLDKHLKRIQEALDDEVTFNVFGVDIVTTQKKVDGYLKFVKENELPLEEIGCTGGEWTLCITPTSLGPIHVVKHSNGNEYDLTEYSFW